MRMQRGVACGRRGVPAAGAPAQLHAPGGGGPAPAQTPQRQCCAPAWICALLRTIQHPSASAACGCVCPVSLSQSLLHRNRLAYRTSLPPMCKSTTATTNPSDQVSTVAGVLHMSREHRSEYNGGASIPTCLQHTLASRTLGCPCHHPGSAPSRWLRHRPPPSLRPQYGLDAHGRSRQLRAELRQYASESLQRACQGHHYHCHSTPAGTGKPLDRG